MGFAQDVKELGPKIEPLMELSKMMTPEMVSAINDISSVDVEVLEKIVIASEKIQDTHKEILLVENGLHDIRRVVEMQNQVANASNNRDSIGLVAGKIQDVGRVAGYLSQINLVIGMSEDIKKILKLPVMEVVENINKIDSLEDTLVDASYIAGKTYENMSESQSHMEMCVNILNKVNIVEKRIDQKLEEVQLLTKQLDNLSIQTVSIETDDTAYSTYNKVTSELVLGIPRGKQGERGRYRGDKGERGNDGRNFELNARGKKTDLVRYGNMPAGFSLLSLDESPTMLYFKKSDAINDWTDGQPFGVTAYEECENAHKLDGYTMDALMGFVYEKVRGEINGSISTRLDTA